MKFALPEPMREATRLTRAGRLSEATALIHRLLGRHGAMHETIVEPRRSGRAADDTAKPMGPAKRSGSRLLPSGGSPRLTQPGLITDHPPATPARGLGGLFRRVLDELHRPGSRTDLPPLEPDVVSSSEFLAASFSGDAGTRPYKLFVPSRYRAGSPVPLIVMLHGCTQSPDDFAAGTRMNDAAENTICLVAYPGQTTGANAQKCWNWFRAADQRRDSGEPSLIAGITREIMRKYSIDPTRVYVAGLSAGGAAAAIMGDAYPDLYAAIGVHSGLACGAARDVASALAAMRQGRAGGSVQRATTPPGTAHRVVPAIVFHGDRDTVVNPRNGDAVVAQASVAQSLNARAESGQVPGGHRFTRTVHTDSNGQSAIEQWTIHGAGHAWSGGNSSGSYTDPRGPDATAEMLRFFLEHPNEHVGSSRN